MLPSSEIAHPSSPPEVVIPASLQESSQQDCNASTSGPPSPKPLRSNVLQAGHQGGRPLSALVESVMKAERPFSAKAGAGEHLLSNRRYGETLDFYGNTAQSPSRLQYTYEYKNLGESGDLEQILRTR